VNCPLCDAPVALGAARCGDCGMTLELAAGRPRVFTNRVFLLWAAGLLAVWLVVLVVVAVDRA
jgi:predicted nucleic acid-binding Zn ribbon protein